MTDKGTYPSNRRWWIALLLSLLWGVGYLYVGRPRRYVAYLTLILVLLALPFHGLWGWLSQPFVFLPYVAGFGAFVLGAMIDTTRLAIVKKGYALRWYNRWWLYLAAFLLGSALSFILEYTPATVAVRNYSVPSESNAPTLRVGEVFTADSRVYEHRNPQRGDMVIFKRPGNEKVDYVKRIIGLPGDVIQLVEGKLFINGIAVDRERIEDYDTGNGLTAWQYLETLPNGRAYRTLSLPNMKARDNGKIYRVPLNHYFVLGDNRDRSADSRFDMGYVPRENIYARAIGIIYSKELRRIGTKLNRSAAALR